MPRKAFKVTFGADPAPISVQKPVRMYQFDSGKYDVNTTYLVAMTGRELNWAFNATEGHQRSLMARHKSNVRKSAGSLQDLREKKERLAEQGRELNPREKLRLEHAEECPVYVFAPEVLGTR